MQEARKWLVRTLTRPFYFYNTTPSDDVFGADMVRRGTNFGHFHRLRNSFR
jgi:hypothetical protein